MVIKLREEWMDFGEEGRKRLCPSIKLEDFVVLIGRLMIRGFLGND
jgi:hypothetical protein